MSVCSVDFDVLESINYELSFSLFGEGSIISLTRDPDDASTNVFSMIGGNELIVASSSSGVLQSGRYRFEISTSGGPEAFGGTPWFYSGSLVVPTPATMLPVLGLAGLGRRRR